MIYERMVDIMTIDLTPVIEAVIGLLGVILTAFVVPLIKQKADESKNEAMLQSLAYWAKIAVQAVEEAGRNGSLPKSQKFDEAMKFLQDKGFTFDMETLEKVVDANVWELINQFEKDKEKK